MALVAGVSDPIDNRLNFGRPTAGWVRILAAGDPPLYTSGNAVLTPSQWLVRGQEISVLIDPAAPEAFEVAWDEIRPIADRAAANDPTLADPLAAHERVLRALHEQSRAARRER